MPRPTQEPSADAWTPDRVDARIAAWRPSASERAWERIGWADGLTRALELGRRLRRPVFLFTHDGRLGIGRC